MVVISLLRDFSRRITVIELQKIFPRFYIYVTHKKGTFAEFLMEANLFEKIMVGIVLLSNFNLDHTCLGQNR
jgi:hypothetical protein